MTFVPNAAFVGFTLHTPTSFTIPGRWGELVLMWPPAAYAEALAEVCSSGENKHG